MKKKLNEVENKNGFLYGHKHNKSVPFSNSVGANFLLNKKPAGSLEDHQLSLSSTPASLLAPTLTEHCRHCSANSCQPLLKFQNSRHVSHQDITDMSYKTYNFYVCISLSLIIVAQLYRACLQLCNKAKI